MSVEVRYEGRVVEVAAGDTVLDGFERAGIAVPSSCRAGACRFCVLRVVSGPVPPGSQDGLTESLRRSGHFLACVSRPERPFACAPAYGPAFRGYVAIQEIRVIGPEIALVRFARPETLAFVPGQFLTLRRDGGVRRSYSIASPASEPRFFDIHVRRIPGGRMSGWLHAEARPRDELWAEGPKGRCTYYPGAPDEPLTLVGTGTGMAPLLAVAEDAVRQGHRGPITLIQGALSEDRLYLRAELEALAARAANVRSLACVRDGPASDEIVVGDLKQLVMTEAAVDATRRVYLCGDPGVVRDLNRRLVLHGIGARRIHADPFVGTD
jgi:ferredoxin-NADP reductase/ferredoxin